MNSTSHTQRPRRPPWRHPLERLLAPVNSVTIREVEWHGDARLGHDACAEDRSVVCLRGVGPPAWFTSGDCRLLACVADAEAPYDSEVVATFKCSDGRRVDVWRATD